MIYWLNDPENYSVVTLASAGAVLAIAKTDSISPVQWYSRWIAEGGSSGSAILQIEGQTAIVLQGENAGQGLLVVWAIENGMASNELVLMLLGEGYGSASHRNPLSNNSCAPLNVPATLHLSGRGALTGASSPFHINGCGHVASAARATLSFTKNLVGRGRIVLSGSSAGPISAPLGAWAKPDRRGVWLLIVRADPRVLALDAQINGDPLGTPWTLENQGPPAILSTPLSTDDTVSQVLSVTLRQTAMDRHGPAVTVRAMRPAAVNPGAGLIPPLKVNAVLMRQNTADYADLCRVQWDWGDATPGLVEITARIRPTNQAFNLGITDHPDFMVEGLAQRIKSKRPTESVYFGVARYERGQSGAVAYAAPITLQLDVGLPAVTATPDEVAGTAVTWKPDQFSAWLAGINPSAEAIWQTAVHRIKWIVAKGGRVALDDFGTFAAIWRPARTRIDPVTGRVIQIPAQRAGSFTPSPGFDRGAQLGRLVRDVEVSA